MFRHYRVIFRGLVFITSSSNNYNNSNNKMCSTCIILGTSVLNFSVCVSYTIVSHITRLIYFALKHKALSHLKLELFFVACCDPSMQLVSIGVELQVCQQ